MSKFKMVKDFYEKNLWSIGRVKDAVVHGWITAEQFKEITGKSYEEVEA